MIWKDWILLFLVFLIVFSIGYLVGKEKKIEVLDATVDDVFDKVEKALKK